ncbi:nodulation receptor kinase-like [Andrographis paniculata]|uniref:nodulation receptor kinase-like n=1 Tax=Andrographis paniculata TaxID=175694 RepID=UPI0021E90FC3|nr:nodulation receptor kinase-like [Andrographis paniculata]
MEQRRRQQQQQLHNAITTLIIIIINFIIFAQSQQPQQGFVSIQCCAEANFTEQITNITYIPDDNWYPDKTSCRDTKHGAQRKSRIFSSEYNNCKWCYTLPTRINGVYLIRATFPLKNASPDSFFKVSIGATILARVNSDSKPYVEAIFKSATKNYTHFCLVKGKGKAFLSKMELRPSHQDYVKKNASRVLKLLDRVDVGNKESDIKYPTDPYDRLWRAHSYHDPTVNYISSSSSSYNGNITIADSMLPPPQVLQTALTHKERLEFYYKDLDEGSHDYNIYLHFLELNNSVRSGERIFHVYINNEKKQEIDILATGSHYLATFLNFTAKGTLNLTLVKAPNARLGPICNAYEILLQTYSGHEEMNEDEVNAITKVKDELVAENKDNHVLQTWSGDPCLPLPWHGLSCEAFNGTLAITKMDLSKSRLAGPLPPSMAELIHLKELNLSSNRFTGTIPRFPASSMLISLDVRNNDLTGNISWSVSDISHLNILYYGCNRHLHERLPQNKSNLITDDGKCNNSSSSHSAKAILIGTIAGGILLVAVVAGACFVCLYRKKPKKFEAKGHTMSKNAIYSVSSTEDVTAKSISIQCFTLECIENATQRYKTLIGEGGFGPVYRGTLPDGQDVAVKVRSDTSTQGTREFNNELNLLSSIRHENLVPLIGYCSENDQQILVYPFMSNGSLQDRLYGAASKRKTLDWPARLSIALGAARGLTYLHTFSERCLIHRDVKSSNILLDHSMCAKVADFGFSKYASQEGDSGTSLEVRGTAGYMDPEYYSTQHLSAKSDVFSFGVVLLEIVCGREPLNINRPRNEWSLVEWAKPHIRNSRVEEIVDPSIKGSYHGEAMWRVVEVALACIEPYSAYRPSMSDLVRELEDAFIIENNASEYMRSIESFGGSNRYSIERPIALPNPIPAEPSPILLQPSPPQPR